MAAVAAMQRVASAVAVMVATAAMPAVVVASSRVRSAGRVWLIQPSVPSVMQWSMPRKLCASWRLRHTAKR
jgi:hypothetical protein